MSKHIFLLLLIAVVGCIQPPLTVESFASPEDQAFAKLQIDRLRQGKFDEIAPLLDPALKAQLNQDMVAKMRSIVPPGEPSKITLLTINQGSMHGAPFTNLTFEYEFDKKWMITNVAFTRQRDNRQIVGFNVGLLNASMAAKTEFRLSNKSLRHYAFLALTIFMPLFTLFALILCIRTRFIGRKWPWIIFILVGLSKVSFNWATGDWMWSPFSIMFLSAGFTALGNSPWILSVAIPYGAIAFLLCRPTLKVPSGIPPIKRGSSNASGPLDYSNILDGPSPRGA